jgi:hypothetical protein
MYAFGDEAITRDQVHFVEDFYTDRPSFRGVDVKDHTFKMWRDKYHVFAIRALKETSSPFKDPEKSLEAACKFNQKKINSSIRNSRVGLRLRTIDEMKESAKRNTFPTPIFEKGYWVNIPNPKYVEPKVHVPVYGIKDKIVLKKPKGRGRRLNSKLKREGLRLLHSLQVPKRDLDRITVRRLRILDSHLAHILTLSEACKRNHRKRREFYSLLSLVPFTKFGVKGSSGSIQTLPTWARRIVNKNLHSNSK